MLALVVGVWAMFGRRFGSAVLSQATCWNPPRAVAVLCAWALIPAFAAQVALLFTQSQEDNGPPDTGWMRTLPLPVYDDTSESASKHALFSAIGCSVGLIETGCLVILILGLWKNKNILVRPTVGVIAVSLGLIALAAPAMSTRDPYEYVGAGILGLHAYAPPAAAFHATIYAPIARYIPMKGVIYGPLWLLIDTVATHFGSTIYAKLEALRVLNALLLSAFFVLLRYGTPRAARIACILNPALWYYAVVNPHAEIELLVLASAALVFVIRKKHIAAMLLVAAAGMVKIVFFVAAAAVLTHIDGTWRRLVYWAGAVALGVAVSYLLAGSAYVHDVQAYAGFNAARAHARGSGFLLRMLPVDCAVMALLVVFRRSFVGAAWLYAQLSPLSAPWYLLWGAPYALATQRFALFVATLPVLAACLDHNIATPTFGTALFLSVLMALSVDVLSIAAQRLAILRTRLSAMR